MQPMKAAVVQLSSQSDVTENLSRVRALVGAAAGEGAALIVLPENFAFIGETEEDKQRVAETLDGRGPITKTLVDLAQAHRIHLIGGGMPEKSDDPKRPFNTSVLVDPGGAISATYRKIHLFDVDLPDGTMLKESNGSSAGNAPVVSAVGDVRVGMTVCYDLRFPELFRKLVDAGARIATVPAAFTLTTGKDHWHVLLRARAIEDQLFVLAAAQHGKHPRGRSTYGKSVIVDPWGDVLAQVGEGEGYAVARLDFDYQDRVRASLPCLAHRRL
ncbi:carbon-nitrogen hydrolase family protein [soil metagenome]